MTTASVPILAFGAKAVAGIVAIARARGLHRAAAALNLPVLGGLKSKLGSDFRLQRGRGPCGLARVGRALLAAGAERGRELASHNHRHGQWRGPSRPRNTRACPFRIQLVAVQWLLRSAGHRASRHRAKGKGLKSSVLRSALLGARFPELSFHVVQYNRSRY